MTESEGGWLPIMHQWVGGVVASDNPSAPDRAGPLALTCPTTPG